LKPLIAVNPVYSHPYTVAKAVSSLSRLYGRKIYLNMIAGTAVGDLRGLGDDLDHDGRYARLGEFILIVQGLLQSSRPFTFQGKFFRLEGIQILPALETALRPEFLISGQSPAATALCEQLQCVRMQMLPPDLGEDLKGARGVNLGIVTRPTKEEAWNAARLLFPKNEEDQMILEYTMKNTDASWKQKLFAEASSQINIDNGYWLDPFKYYKSDCPYLVGSYEYVLSFFERLKNRGVNRIILDIVPEPLEFEHICRSLGPAIAG
jgi:alkanesulfonate monooxygenase